MRSAPAPEPGEAPDMETVELLQGLIRNACVNDGSPSSGQETRNAALLRAVLEGPGVELESYEPLAGRTSLVARIEGRERSAPTLCYLAHTDVVPVNAARWRHDPFGGELVDGEVWGRGAIDMLNLTASMAVATARLARSGFRTRGTLVYAAVADEEALGTYGTGWLAEHAPEAVRADFVVTESGGVPLPTPAGLRLPVVVGEKGSYWARLRVRGTAAHASRPLRTDNAVVTAAEVVTRLARYRPPARVSAVWERFVAALGLPPELEGALTDPERVSAACDELPLVGLAREAHASTHTTIAPTIVRGGTKVNVIPDEAELDLDIRTLVGDDAETVERLLEDALGELWPRVELVRASFEPASISPLETPLWDALTRAAQSVYPGSLTVPVVTVGATDARFARRLGAVAYGFGLFSRRMDFERFSTMFHGDDERVDVESLGLSTALFSRVAEDLLS